MGYFVIGFVGTFALLMVLDSVEKSVRIAQ